MKLIGLVGIATLLGAYDLNIFGLAAKQILTDFGHNENMTGPTIAIFRLGVFGALLLCLMADIVGRRRLLLFTILGMALSTLATAFAPNYEAFLAAQLMVRVFAYAEDMLCIVVIAEEFEERTRGWAIGTLGALAAAGAGVAVLMFALVNLLPFGWRAIYVLGAVPLLLLAWMRRDLPETRRFAALKAAGGSAGGIADAWRPLVALLRAYPGRLGLLTMAVAAFSFGIAPAIGLMPTFLQSAHGWTPGMVSSVILGTGIVGLALSMWVGRLSDTVGRRPTQMVGIFITLSGFLLLYTGDQPWMLVLGILFGVFGQVAVAIQAEAFGAELFPTAYRATASAMRFLAGVLAGAAGLLLHGNVLAPEVGFGTAVLILMIPVPLGLIGIALLPETAGKSLEDISRQPETG
jgi:putative MFS transporter